MKDKKKLTYILIAGSLLVWGMVIYKLFSYIDGGDDSMTRHNSIVASPHIIEKEEEYTLLLNYRDPFLGKAEASLEKNNSGSISTKKKKVAKTIKVPEKPLDISFISYAGMITNPTTKKKVALVTIKGKQSMVSEGEVLDEIIFIKNYKDSIQISYLGKTAFVKRF